MTKSFILLAWFTLILASGCKKENTELPNKNNISLPPSETASWDALADNNAQQYMIIVYQGDTVVLQDTRRLTVSLSQDLSQGLSTMRGIKAAFFSTEHPNFNMELRLIKRSGFISNTVSPVDCPLLDELANNDTFSVTGNQYYVSIHWNDMFNDFATEYYDPARYNGNYPNFVVKECRLISSTAGCNTYQIKGIINCMLIYTGCTDMNITRSVTVYACYNLKVPN